MDVSTLAATALTCVAMFQAPRELFDEAIFVNDGFRTRQVFDLDDATSTGGRAWFFTNAGTAGSVLFSSFATTTGRELWTTKGRTASTRLLRDINLGSQLSSDPGTPTSFVEGGTAYTTRFQKVGSSIIFPATTSQQGREMWVSDGTTAGTRLLKDHMPGPTNGSGQGGVPELLISNGLFAIYLVTDQLRGSSFWATDGTPTGTRFLRTYQDNQRPWIYGALGNDILFADNWESELWITNGTEAGTRLVKTFKGGAIANISRLKGTSYALMSVFTTTEGQELWITDGTAIGTKLLKNINPNSGNSNPGAYNYGSEYGSQGAYFKIGDRVVFPAFDTTAGRELWVTRGTPASTVRLANLSAGVAGSDFYQFTVLNDKVYFAADVLEGGSYVRRPFVTDGTPAGTRKLSTSLQVAGRMVSLSNTVIFPAFGPNFEPYLWKTGDIPNSQTRVSPILIGIPSHLQAVEIPSANGVHSPCPVN